MFKHPDSGLYVRIGLHVQGGANMNSCTMITRELINFISRIIFQPFLLNNNILVVNILLYIVLLFVY